MSDLISRQDLIELIEKINPQSALELGYLYQIREYIKQTPTVEPQEWIPVKDRLPEDYVRVLVCDRTSVYMANRHDDWWYFSPAEIGTLVAQSHIVAWMPLPSPYKGDE